MGMSKRQFEAENETNDDVAVAAPQAPVPVVAPARAVAVASVQGNVLADLKNAMPVEFNTLDALAVTNGRFLLKGKDEDLGEQIEVELLSYQATFVCSPNQKDADKSLVKYGTGTPVDSDGVALSEHLAELKSQGFSKATLRERVTLVGGLLKCDKKPDLVGTPVQIDLPPTSKAAFDRYMITASYKVGKGLLDPAKAVKLLMKCVLAKGQGSDKYTLVEFSTAA